MTMNLSVVLEYSDKATHHSTKKKHSSAAEIARHGGLLAVFTLFYTHKSHNILSSMPCTLIALIQAIWLRIERVYSRCVLDHSDPFGSMRWSETAV